MKILKGKYDKRERKKKNVSDGGKECPSNQCGKYTLGHYGRGNVSAGF